MLRGICYQVADTRIELEDFLFSVKVRDSLVREVFACKD